MINLGLRRQHFRKGSRVEVLRLGLVRETSPRMMALSFMRTSLLAWSVPWANRGKIRNSNAGKNSQVGPRIRDAKNQARANSALKLAFKVLGGPTGGKKKENRNPNVKGVVKGKLPIYAGPIPPKFRSNQEKDLLKECLKEKINIDASGELRPHFIPVEDTNPLLGFITPTDVAKSREEISPSSVVRNNDVRQYDALLSEQNPSSGSK